MEIISTVRSTAGQGRFRCFSSSQSSRGPTANSRLLPSCRTSCGTPGVQALINNDPCSKSSISWQQVSRRPNCTSGLPDGASCRPGVRPSWRAATGGGTPGAAPAKLVTVLGKGGSGKTTAAVLLAKLYASQGKRVCLAVQGQDTVAEDLLGTNLTASATPVPRVINLSALRMEATKLLLEPLAQLRKADASVGFSNGALDEVVGEELSILPGMDAFLVVGALERLARPGGGILGKAATPEWAGEPFDIVVYDGQSNGEVLRMFGSAERSRWYLRRMRRLAEKTDAGRVALPTVARVLDSAVERGSSGRERTTSEVWQAADEVLERAAEAFLDPNTFACFLVAEAGNEASQKAALRLWGSACQAGMHVQAALLSPGRGGALSSEGRFAALPVAKLPSMTEKGGQLTGVEEVQKVLGAKAAAPRPVRVNMAEGTVALFLPGFDKSEVKLSKRGGGAELLVEVGDQRRSVELPAGMRGKVSGAKFQDGMLTVTLTKETVKKG